MIAFASLFLGLVLGTQTVEVIVDGPVAAVEYRLDGRTVARATKAPWSARVDLGRDLAPHEFEAIALDGGGGELARARQWLNLPRRRAEARIVFERDGTGRAVAGRIASQSIMGSRPVALHATFDGHSISVDGSGRVSLPAYDEHATHLLSVEMEFPGGTRSRADAVLGGASREEAETELTAIAMRGGDGDPPGIAGLTELVLADGKPARVVAVERGPAQVILVRDRGNQDASKVLGGYRYLQPALERTLRFDLTLRRRDRVRFLWPVAKHYPDARVSSDLFDQSRDFTSGAGGFHWLLTRVFHPDGGLPRQRLTDAAAVAGLEVFASSTRRAVVLVLGEATDASRFDPAMVREYLAKLGVPLHVWSLADPTARPDIARWGAVSDIAVQGGLKSAFRRLKEDLESQFVVWIEGKHLPQTVTLSENASGLRLVR